MKTMKTPKAEQCFAKILVGPYCMDDSEMDAGWCGMGYADYGNDCDTRTFDVTPHIRPGERNTIAFRIFKSFDHGGTYDRVFLVADPSEQ